FSGTSASLSRAALDSRQEAVSRDSNRAALADAADQELQDAVEAQAEERNAALAQLAASAERYAGEIAENAWQLPLSGYELTAQFGYSSSLWSSTHTGLDFAAPYGTPVVSIANGTVESTEYAGSYGNRVVVTLEDGTEIWYCHLDSFAVSPGQSVVGGEQVGAVGSTGNSTGAHLHLEVRPGAGDAVDPYAALVAHGLNP
ncbi:MAG: M23 family metallopeptidase, partial [Nocardioidaceae bacterium]